MAVESALLVMIMILTLDCNAVGRVGRVWGAAGGFGADCNAADGFGARGGA